ncbi:MAG: 1,4-dihydroxy-2-naphthoate octaprenyltransferase [Flavobacteriales bacterium]|nr:1,4-dihydroxy-2-naphthoate octaprenyltransferase [Flavobacteriales bacterium]
MNTFLAWIYASRLRTLPLSLSGILMGAGIALKKGVFDVSIFVMACVTTILYQVLSNLANDYGDGVKGTDKNRIGPKRALESGMLSKSQMKKGLIVVGVLSFISTILLLYLSFIPNHLDYFFGFIGLGIGAILAALFYTMGKNPYGYHGLGDAFVFLFFGLVSVVGSFFLYAKYFDWELLLPASAIGFFSVAVLNLNNMRDIENDEVSGKKTLAVKMGLKYAKIYEIVLLNLPFFLTLIYILIEFPPLNYYYMLFLLLIFVFAPLRREILYINEPKKFDPYLKKVSLLTLVFVILFVAGLNYELVF